MSWLKRRIAHAGMAHFPGTGPEGKTCKDCASLSDLQGKFVCLKFKELMRLKSKKQCPVIHSGWMACKYFEAKG